MEFENNRRFFSSKFKTGILVSRPNRFVVIFNYQGVNEGASLPNPGKLGELFIPGAILYLQKMGSHVKYPYRVIAVESENGEIIMLDTHMNNRVAEFLIQNQKIPSLHGYKVKRREVPVGHSRFDLLLENDLGMEIYCEVKSCTLFGGGLAMFPDAVTERGRRHVSELAEMSDRGIKTVILIVIQSCRIEAFCPDYHTDPAFSRTLYDSRNKVAVIPVTAGWNRNLALIPEHRELPVLWELYEKEGQVDRGNYIMQFRMEEDVPEYRPGYYLYLSYEDSDLGKCIERYKRKKKTARITREYLRNEAKLEMTWTIRVEHDFLKEISHEMELMGFKRIMDEKNFSLFFSDDNPRLMRSFQNMLLLFRMVKPYKRFHNHIFDQKGE